jgi:N-acetylmuramoyl-L-alanine amidase
MRPINEIIIHCTATRPEWWANRSLAQKIAEVRLWHTRDRGWKDIGYHYLIDRDGKVGEGRPLDQIGAHTQGKNTGTIGISLFGGHGSAVTDPFGANFTPAQEQALIALIADLRGRFPAITKITGHNQYAAKACPGFDVPTWLDTTAQPAPLAPTPVPTQPDNSPLRAFLAWLAGVFQRRP